VELVDALSGTGLRRIQVASFVSRKQVPSMADASGFGQTGPLAQRASYDRIIQGYCGLMSLTGDAETVPMKAGLVVCDTTAAIIAAFAIAATCEALGLPELKTDSRFAERDDRTKNQRILRQILEGHLATDTAGAWESKLVAHSVPAGPVYTVPRLPSMRRCVSAGSCGACMCGGWSGTCRWLGRGTSWAGNRCRSRRFRRRWGSIVTL
jgi:crotonobetainyl-CoA:carnitine CoA-transferase CaiB-like acyl-CoA transferase